MVPADSPGESGRARRAGVGGGHYRLLGELGRGKMRIVYRALDEIFQGEVALECPRPDPPGDAKLLERFIREARTLSNLSHPSVQKGNRRSY